MRQLNYLGITINIKNKTDKNQEIKATITIVLKFTIIPWYYKM